MDYKKFYGKSWEWDKHWDVRNTWYRFSFENEHSASMFALVFSEWIKPPTKWHPDHPDDEEYLNRPEEERYTK
jgi:DNA gyrase inhibitor GyrI